MHVEAHGRLSPVHLPSSVKLSSVEFWELCRLNRDWRFERHANGDILIMAPTGGRTGARNSRILSQLNQWAERDGGGVAFDSSTGFELPNGATRSPDAAWVSRERLAGLSEVDKERFLPLCPEFVIELASPSDDAAELRAKMEEYVANGAGLGWLIDPASRCVLVYRPSHAVEKVEGDAVSADPLLPGFVLDLRSIWAPPF